MARSCSLCQPPQRGGYRREQRPSTVPPRSVLSLPKSSMQSPSRKNPLKLRTAPFRVIGRVISLAAQGTVTW